MPSANPSEEYNQRLQDRERQAASLEQVHLRLGNLRLLLVIAALTAAWFSLDRKAFSAWWLLAFPALFLATAIVHARTLCRRAKAESAADFYRRGLARIEDRWAGSGQTGDRIDTSSSLYAADLDLFGSGSLFELLSLARTRMGEDTLARWLLAPSPLVQLKQRHAALDELRHRLDLREDLSLLGSTSGSQSRLQTDDLKAAVHPEALAHWAEAPNLLQRPWLRWLSLLLALAAVASAIVWAELGTKAPFFTILAFEIIVTASLRKQTAQVLHSTEHALEDLQLLSSLLARLEAEQFASPHLQVLHSDLSSHRGVASQSIASLKTIVEFIRSLENPILRGLNIPLLYAVQTAYAAESWRSTHGASVRRWLSAIGQFEALVSLAGYSYEHPADPFPEFLEGSPCFTASALGHPLIPAAQCVRNDLSLCGETKALVISGSNMSGKSTLMRAVGINTVLAMAGAPVRAVHMKLTPLHLGASILVNDSLQEGSSRFYAEISRLRSICDLAEQHPPVLFLLDELLQGTNSQDRLAGAEGVVRALLDSGSIGLLSTHDLALTHLGGQHDHRLRNVHFQDRIEDGRMAFDFKLREGIVTRSNGIELMRLIGLKV